MYRTVHLIDGGARAGDFPESDDGLCVTPSQRAAQAVFLLEAARTSVAASCAGIRGDPKQFILPTWQVMWGEPRRLRAPSIGRGAARMERGY